MKKILIGLFLVCFLFGNSYVYAAELRVGAVADRLGKGMNVSLIGRTSPLAEIVVVDPKQSDLVIAVAEIEKNGEFEFGFVTDLSSSELVVFAVDDFGVSSRVPLSEFLNDSIELMPPTIVNDKADQGIKNLAIKGMTYPGSQVEIELVSQSDQSKTVYKTTSDIAGVWRLNSEDIRPGKYSATAISSSNNLISKRSQELFFEIALLDVPTPLNNYWQNFWSNLSLDPSLLLLLMAPFVWFALNKWGFWRSIATALWPLFGYRGNKFGVVYDAVTKEPLQKVLVVLRNFASNKILSITFTDRKGEFWFDIKGGEYRIEVLADNYLFPSNLIKGKGDDGQYLNIYHGEKKSLRRGDTVRLSVPLDPITTIKSSSINSNKLLLRLRDLITSLWFVVCVVWSVILFIYYPDIFHLCILLYYLLVIAWYFRSWQTDRKTSLVVDQSGVGVPDVLVGIYTWPTLDLSATRVSDQEGRLRILLEPGKFTTKIFDDRYLLEEVVGTTKGIFELKDESWVELTFKVKAI